MVVARRRSPAPIRRYGLNHHLADVQAWRQALAILRLITIHQPALLESTQRGTLPEMVKLEQRLIQYWVDLGFWIENWNELELAAPASQSQEYTAARDWLIESDGWITWPMMGCFGLEPDPLFWPSRIAPILAFFNELLAGQSWTIEYAVASIEQITPIQPLPPVDMAAFCTALADAAWPWPVSDTIGPHAIITWFVRQADTDVINVSMTEYLESGAEWEIDWESREEIAMYADQQRHGADIYRTMNQLANAIDGRPDRLHSLYALFQAAADQALPIQRRQRKKKTHG